MNDSFLLWLALAVGVFWSVGVYNRLMRMRTKGLDALMSVEKALRQYAELVRGQEPALASGPLHIRAGGPGAVWSSLTVAWQETDEALKEAVSMPLADAPLSRLASCLAELQRAWVAVCETPADLAGPIVPEGLRIRWETIGMGVETSCNQFNHLMNTYNHALNQFPASLIVGLLAFKPAGRL